MLVVTVGFKVSLRTAKTVATCNNGVCDLAVDKMWRVLIGKFLTSTFFSRAWVLLTIILFRLRSRPRLPCALLPAHYPGDPTLHIRCG